MSNYGVEKSNELWWDITSTLPSIEAPTIALLLALLSVGYYALFKNTFLRRNNGKKYPPYAPGGIWETTRRRLASKSGYWMLVSCFGFRHADVMLHLMYFT